MKLAAIDIGSNAIRLQVSHTIQTKGILNFKKLEYVRFPLRLGHDVFNTGSISPGNVIKFKKLMQSYKILVDLFEVDDFMGCATSAMREAKNGRQLIKEVEEELNLKINIIDGQREAILINNAIHSFLDHTKNYLHIDVGGGSTELNVYVKGKKVATRSFKIGSVRRLEHHDSPIIWKNMKKWVEDNLKGFKNLIAIGTGGNINKLFEMASAKPGKKVKLSKLQELKEQISSMPMHERIHELQLNPDRADVIVPASDIYISVMQWAKTEVMLVPAVGLKDGIMLYLYQKNTLQEKIQFS